MALSDDQRALLRLLAKREEGYEDIAALKGKSVEEVRSEVADALAELEASGEKAQSPSTVREPALGPRVPTKLADKPKPAAGKPSKSARRSAPRIALPADVQRRRLLLLTGGALAVVAVVLIAIAVLGGDSDSSSNGTEASSLPTASGADGKVTQAVLTSPDGGDASGRAVFGRVGKEEIVLQVTAENLEPTADGESYTIWLYRTPKLTLRVGAVPVGDEGTLGAQLPIPAELLAYVASGAFNQIYISRTNDAAYQAEVARAKREKSLPRYTGETVLTGKITGPVAEAARGG